MMRTEIAGLDAPPPGSFRSFMGTVRRLLSAEVRSAPAAASALTLVALAPMISVVVQRAGRPYLPLQDQAIVDLRVRDVLTFSHNTPLVGVYSHFGWNHPGPLFFYMAAPLTWLFGYAGWSTLVAFAALQGIAVVWTARLAWKTGGLSWTTVWLSIMALSYVGVGPSLLQLAWNPSIALPYFVLFCLQCWVVGRGQPSRLVGLVFVGSFLVQTHLGYAPLVAALALWAGLRMGMWMVQHHRRVRLLDVPASVAILVVLWFPVLVLDPLLDPSSNLARMVHFYLAPPNALHIEGWRHGLGLLATEFRWLPPWMGGSDPVSDILGGIAAPSNPGWLAVPACLLALAWWATRRRDRDDLRRLVELLTVLIAAGAVSLALIRGEPNLYLLYWRVVVGAASVVLLATVLLETVGSLHWGRSITVWPAMLAAALTVGAIYIAPAAGNVQRPYARAEPIVQSLLAQLRQSDQPDGPALIRPWGGTMIGVAAAMVDQMLHEGRPVYVDRSLGYEVGYGHTTQLSQVRWVLFVIENSAIYNIARSLPGARVVAVDHPIPSTQMDELAQVQDRVMSELRADGFQGDYQVLGAPLVALLLGNQPGVLASDLHELSRLNAAVAAHGCLCSVIEFPSNPGLTFQPGYMASVVSGRPGPNANPR